MSRYAVPVATSEEPHTSEILVRRSRFLASCARASDVASARAFVKSLRRCYPDATHNCWAYVAGPPGDTSRIGASDDGEPHGTAGRPMLNVLLCCGTGEICMVVSRWFGGVKLGTSGLVRAYRYAARENLAGIALTERLPSVRCVASLAYAYLDGLYHILPRFEAKIITQEHQTTAKFQLELPKSQCNAFKKALAGLTNGAAVFTISEKNF
ncbi:MAG: YigZ family protein [Desulfovibrio sp.]|jgi:uncharacterized YigZ family protein|nr:YigZ family protein [Desulfovibrio sp.]